MPIFDLIIVEYKKDKTITNKEIILNTLEHINDKGFVDVKPLWNSFSITEDKQTLIKQTLTKNELVRLGCGQPLHFEITDPKGVYVLNNPDKLKENGELKLGISKRVELLTKKYWLMTLILTSLRSYIGGIFSPIFTEMAKQYFLKEKRMKQSPKALQRKLEQKENPLIVPNDSL